jgi:hypothetical protein
VTFAVVMTILSTMLSQKWEIFFWIMFFHDFDLYLTGREITGRFWGRCIFLVMLTANSVFS